MRSYIIVAIAIGFCVFTSYCCAEASSPKPTVLEAKTYPRQRERDPEPAVMKKHPWHKDMMTIDSVFSVRLVLPHLTFCTTEGVHFKVIVSNECTTTVVVENPATHLVFDMCRVNGPFENVAPQTLVTMKDKAAFPPLLNYTVIEGTSTGTETVRFEPAEQRVYTISFMETRYDTPIEPNIYLFKVSLLMHASIEGARYKAILDTTPQEIEVKDCASQ